MLHRRPEVFVDPERFDPDRWTDGSRKRANGHLPFGGGPRICIGKQLRLDGDDPGDGSDAATSVVQIPPAPVRPDPSINPATQRWTAL